MKKTKKSDNYTNNWFDTENARLIILCAILGIFGAHKFAQHKKGQGILFLLLDLTVIGILITGLWAFLDLVFLTAKRDNKPGNMIFGSIFLLVQLTATMSIGTSNLFENQKKQDLQITQEETVNKANYNMDTF